MSDEKAAEAEDKSEKELPRTKVGNVNIKGPKITFTKVKYLANDERGRWKKDQVVEFHTPTAASQIELGLAKYESGTKLTPAKDKDEE